MSMTKLLFRGTAALALSLCATLACAGHITPELTSVDVVHEGKHITITRADSPQATIPEPYLKTGRHCPPFCIQPMKVAEGVETIGELEVLRYLDQAHPNDPDLIGTPPVLVVDSRTPEWIARGTIPGSVNIPWTTMSVDEAGGFPTNEEMAAFTRILINDFGARKVGDLWDFSKAQTLVLFCNGIWCGQSSANIKTLLRLGYPASKLKWYRGGMQDWVSAGLTTVKE